MNFKKQHVKIMKSKIFKTFSVKASLWFGLTALFFNCSMNINAQCSGIMMSTNESSIGANDAKAAVAINPTNKTFNWSNGSNLPVIENLSAGWYYITINDTVTNCVNTDSVLVSIGLQTKRLNVQGRDAVELYFLDSAVNTYFGNEYCEGKIPFFYTKIQILGLDPTLDTVNINIHTGDGNIITAKSADYLFDETVPYLIYQTSQYYYLNNGVYDVSYLANIDGNIGAVDKISELEAISCLTCNLQFNDITVIPANDLNASASISISTINGSSSQMILSISDKPFTFSIYGGVDTVFYDSTIYTTPLTSGLLNYGNTNSCVIVYDYLTNCLIDSCFYISIDSSIVWPGDANSDGIANVFDVFPVGIAYNTSGSIRVGASNTWVGQISTNWPQNFAGGINYKHADCNGDGIIDYLDGLPILLNYGLTHSKGDVSATVTDPTLFYELPVDTTMVSATLSIPIMLGTPSIPAQDVYGIAFTVTFDPALVDTSSVEAVFNTSWLGVEGTDMFTIQKRFGAAGELHVGMVRTNQVNIATAFGQIATLNIVVADDLAGKTNTYENLILGFKDVKLISFDETEQPVNTSTSVLVISDISASVSYKTLLSNLVVYPNPVQDVLMVEYSKPIESITLLNLNGQVVIKTNPISNITMLSLSDLAKGTYFLQVQTGEGVVTKKVVKK